MPKSQPRKYSNVMATSHGVVSRRGQKMAARLSQLLPLTAITAHQLPRASRPTLPRTQPGKCRVLFAMYQDLVAMLTRPAPMLSLGLILFLLPNPTTATAVPAMVVNQTLDLRKARHNKMSHTDRAQVQVLWALPAEQGFHLFFLHSWQAHCDIVTSIPILLHLSICFSFFLGTS